MEHRLLIDPVSLGRENLLETYVGLARAVPGATIQAHENCLVANGPTDLSFCNFAAGFGPVENPQRRLDWLTQVAAQTGAFWVFCMDGDQPSRLDSELIARGFIQRQSLDQLVLGPRTQFDEAVETAEEAPNPALRAEICNFAVRLFFTRTPETAQRRIAEATAKSAHRLYQLRDKWGIAATMMLCESQSAVGLYNLCVRHDRRREGLASSLVVQASDIAADLHKPLVLQCDTSLTGWYERMGFEHFGTVDAYTFSVRPVHDIII